MPNIVTTDQPGDTWTVETSFTAPLAKSAQQGGLVVYLDEKNYVKLDAIAVDDGTVRFELRSEVGDVTQNPQPQVEKVAKPVYGEYLLRLSRAGDTFTGQFSVDNGQTWTALPEGVKNSAAKDAGSGSSPSASSRARRRSTSRSTTCASWTAPRRPRARARRRATRSRAPRSTRAAGTSSTLTRPSSRSATAPCA
ncbi:hypothetical protein NKG05_22500 [Oerskovia sp. M15]